MSRSSHSTESRRHGRSRQEVIDDLEDRKRLLDANHNDIVLKELQKLVVELRKLVAKRATGDEASERLRWNALQDYWAQVYQNFADTRAQRQAERTPGAAASLPREEAVLFKGDNAKAFWAHYEASIFSNDRLNARQKMSHFISRLKDHSEAAHLAAGFSPDGTEIDKCVAAFKARYLDPKWTRAEALKKARDLPALPDFDNLLATTHFISQVRVIKGILQEGASQNDREYVQSMRVLVLKLSPLHQTLFFKHHCKAVKGRPQNAPEPKPFDTFLTFLEEEEEAAGWKRFFLGDRDKERGPRGEKRLEADRYGSHKRARKDNPKILVVSADKCALCDTTKHATSECDAGTPESRFAKLGSLQLCYGCATHKFARGRPCEAKKSCAKCQGVHITAFCGLPRYAAKTLVVHKPATSDRSYLTAIQATLVHKGTSVRANVVLDTCAETTLITQTAVQRLSGRAQSVPPIWLSGISDGLRDVKGRLEFQLASIDQRFSRPMQAYVIGCITKDNIRAPSELIQRQAAAHGISLEATLKQSGAIDLLIGQDQLFPLWMNEIVPLGPLIGAFRTQLGWMIAGNESGAEPVPSTPAVQLSCTLCTDLATVLDHMQLKDGEGAVEEAQRTLKIEYDARKRVYTVGLPKRSLEHLDHNYYNAFRRLESLRRKLQKDGRYEEYHEVIMDYVKKGYAEVVGSPTVRAGTYTIPHHAVYRQDATKTKCRVVFDASSHSSNLKSLNQCLSKGESINADVWAVSLRFRLAPIVLLTDLVKAFSQIRIHESDRDLLRYLWYAEPGDAMPTMFRMTSVSFGVTSSPFMLGAVLRDHTNRFASEFPQVAAQMNHAVYMDDAVFVADNIMEAEELMSQAQAFFNKASFQLHPWVTNEAQIQSEQEMADPKETHKCLGILWSPVKDELALRPVEIASTPATLRDAVSALSKHYDPLSLFAPMKTRLRLLVRELAPVKGEWDTPLTEERKKRMRKVLKELEELALCSVPRTLRTTVPWSLHVFCDASPQAFGAVAYLISGSNRLLLCAQVKLAPKKFTIKAAEQRGPNVTVPRLELMAAVLGIRLTESVLPHLPSNIAVALYSDSDVTLKRISSDLNKYDAFEMNRLQVILETTTAAHWHYVPTKENPADLLTRDRATKSWLQCELWWQGPGESFPLATPVPLTRRTALPIQLAVPSDEERALLKMTWLEALEHIREQEVTAERLGRENKDKARPLSQDELALTILWRLVQKELFPEEYSRLEKGLWPKATSRLRSLRPFLDEWGILRSRRMAQPPELAWEIRHPIIIASHPLVKGFIRQEHARLAHVGVRHLRNHLASHYHLIGGRRLIKGLISTCKQCNIERGKPFSTPEPALPSFRTEQAVTPFQNVGLDYLGPLKIRGKRKVYILLITCAVTRAVHLEVVASLNAQQCLNALERFFSRRGVPKEIHSDNAKTFVGVDRALETLAGLVEKASRQPAIQQKHAIRWIFQVPRAPWWGGFFERLVQVVKHRLQHTEIRRTCSSDEITTIVCQVEAIINSRPLIDAESDGLPPLTPAHFIVGHSLLSIPMIPSAVGPPSSEKLLEDYRRLRDVRQEYANRLRQDYVLALRRHHLERKSTREPRLEEFVLVSGEEGLGRDRFEWPIAQIKELFRGEDGVIRAARILMHGKLYLRPIRSLIPLEGLANSAPPPGGEDVAVLKPPPEELAPSPI